MVAFLPFLGAAPLFDWDEINFAESAREMMVSGNYFQVQINFEPFWEKPPLFIWMQVLSMKLFGVNAFAARLPNALVGVATLCLLYAAGTRLRHRFFGWLVAGFYFVSILPHLYFKSGIIDPAFNLFIFAGLYQVLLYERGGLAGAAHLNRRPWLAGFWIGLATLTKGPVALLVTMLVYFSYKLIYDRRRWPWAALGKFTLVYLLVILSWFGSIVLLTEDGLETVRKFIVYQVELFLEPVAGHEQPFFYHLVVFAVGCFPLAAFAFRGMGMRFAHPSDLLVKRFMLVWFWVVMVLFTIVRTKIVHYSSLVYYPGAFLAAFWFYELIRGRKRMRWDNYALYGLGVLVFGVGFSLVSIAAANLDAIAARSTDSFAKTNLTADVPWTGWEFLPGLVLLIGCLIALWFMVRKRFAAALAVHMAVMPFAANGIDALVLPRIADYTQNAAVEFFQAKAKEDAYIMVEGYKTYAHYFYGEVKPFPHPEIPKEKRGDWMARGPVDKPVYLVSRIDRVSAEFEQVWFEHFRPIGSKAGFVFYLRELTNPPTP